MGSGASIMCASCICEPIFWLQNQPFRHFICSSSIVTLPLRKLMAATLPTKSIHVSLTKWSFSLNPGPFSMKGHALITIIASCGSSGVYAIGIITIVKAFYHRSINPTAGFMLALSTQLLGYGWAGIFRKFHVDSPYMWWPANLVHVSLFRTFHEKEKRPVGGYTKLQFCILVFVASFAYYIIIGYFFQGLSAISIVCLIWKNSVTAK
ncbi:PREDICTED: oligopeptide transporter 1-like [Lupinus angustifolius]|uniref:oligopeptide transporter 1-like n=1 Tax=Lupinus angustifolius TaxID=3871 RepID=UPI00092F18A9|nr:PREDICTED: oligopeptide transporter 1-like [Lupinus angustifolius]